MMSKLNNWIIKFLDKAHLNTSRILITYICALLLIPVFFSFFMILEVAITKSNVMTIMKSPYVAVDVIIIITDFILGYYLWLKKDNFLYKNHNYRFFMTCQLIGQLLVGNLFCSILALFGLISLRSVKKGWQENSEWLIKVISIAFIFLFGICSAIIILLKVKNSR